MPDTRPDMRQVQQSVVSVRGLAQLEYIGKSRTQFREEEAGRLLATLA